MPVGVSPREYSQPSLPYKQTKGQSVEGSNRSAQSRMQNSVLTALRCVPTVYALLRHSETQWLKRTPFLPWQRACLPHTFPATSLYSDRRVPPGQGSFPFEKPMEIHVNRNSYTHRILKGTATLRDFMQQLKEGGTPIYINMGRPPEQTVNWIERWQSRVCNWNT